MLSKSPRGRPENVLGTSRINLHGTSLGRHFETSPGRQIGTSPGRQFGTSLGWSNRIFRRRPGDVGGGRPGDQYLPAGIFILSKVAGNIGERIQILKLVITQLYIKLALN